MAAPAGTAKFREETSNTASGTAGSTVHGNMEASGSLATPAFRPARSLAQHAHLLWEVAGGCTMGIVPCVPGGGDLAMPGSTEGGLIVPLVRDSFCAKVASWCPWFAERVDFG